jgi:hypothetical protein
VVRTVLHVSKLAIHFGTVRTSQWVDDPDVLDGGFVVLSVSACHIEILNQI